MHGFSPDASEVGFYGQAQSLVKKKKATPRVKKNQFFGFTLLYGPTLTSIHVYWKNHSFDYTDLS